MKEAVELLLDWRNGLALLLAIGIALVLHLNDAAGLFVLFVFMLIATRLAVVLAGRVRARRRPAGQVPPTRPRRKRRGRR